MKARLIEMLVLALGAASASWPLPGRTALGQEPPARQPPIQIGLRKQLFVDDDLIASRANVSRELGKVTKANDGKPIVVADQPWEQADLFRLGSVFRDGERFRMWYQMNDDLTGYAESADGLQWTKPRRGFREFQGSRDNNSVDPKGFVCFLDPHETDPLHKYKAAYAHEKVMAALAHSADGFDWIPYNGGAPVTGRAADTINQLLWDEDAKTYRLYTRTDYGQGRYGGTLDEDRGTRDMTNPDVKANPSDWKIIRQWKFDRQGRWEFKRRQVYSLNGWLYEGIHFGLLWCYEWPGQLGEGPYDLTKRHERDIMNCYLLTTRGERMWDVSWVYGEKPLIPRGGDGDFDKDWVQPAPNIVTWQDKHWIFFSGSRERHDIYRVREGLSRWQAAIGLATLRLDGFVCLRGKEQPGAVITHPLKLEGNNLEINADASRGWLAVEVLDERGEPIAGYTRQDCRLLEHADGLRLRPRWQDHADLSGLEGKIVRLKFYLRDADLYAFQVVSD